MQQMVSAYVRELFAETVLRVFLLVDGLGVVVLVAWQDAQTFLKPGQWALTLGVLGYVLANYQLYRKNAPD